MQTLYWQQDVQEEGYVDIRKRYVCGIIEYVKIYY